MIIDKFSKSDVQCGKNDEEAVVGIMKYLMDRLNEIPDGDFSSSNIFTALFYLNKRIIQAEVRSFLSSSFL